jgi:hypothetical protein
MEVVTKMLIRMINHFNPYQINSPTSKQEEAIYSMIPNSTLLGSMEIRKLTNTEVLVSWKVFLINNLSVDSRMCQ